MKYILGALGLLCVAACNQPVLKSNKIAYAAVDTSKYAILKFDKIRDGNLFGTKVQPATLSNNDILKIEVLIKRQVDEYNKTEEVRERQYRKDPAPNEYQYDNLIHHPEKYYKQIIAIVNSKGEKEVWVNCFRGNGEKSYWKESIVQVDDGGSYFFNLKINLTKNIVYDFMVNGVG